MIEVKVEFNNPVIQMSSLPALEKTNFQSLEKDYLWLRVLFISIVLLIVGSVALFIGIISDLTWWQPMVVVGIIFSLIYFTEWKGFSIKGYALRQKDVSFKSGLVFFSMTSVPFNRVQHTEVNQTPLARLFDLGEVKIYTAGGATSDLIISGLKIGEAHQLKDHITILSSKYA
mgnify:CR=1 FL=1